MDDLVDKVAEERMANLLLNNQEKLDGLGVGAHLFTDGKLRSLVKAAIELRVTGTEVTPANIGIASGDDGLEDAAAKMLTRELAPGSFDLLLSQLTDLAARRQISAFCKEYYEKCFDLEVPSDEISSSLESKVIGVGKKSHSGVKDGGDMREILEEINWRAANPCAVRGTRFGFPKLETMLDGLSGGQLYVIGARPSVGKSALMTQMAMNLMESGKKPFVVSLEMKGDLLKTRMVASVAGVSLGISKERAFTDHELMALRSASERLSSMDWWYVDSARMDVADICSTARRMKKENGIGSVFVDYVQIVQNKEFKANESRLRVGESCFKLKQLAEELDIPVVVLAQLRRKEGVFNRVKGSTEIPEPELHDLKECGNIEEDADVVMLMHRDQRENACYTELRVAKNRNGETGLVTLEFTPHTTSFKEENYD